MPKLKDMLKETERNGVFIYEKKSEDFHFVGDYETKTLAEAVAIGVLGYEKNIECYLATIVNDGKVIQRVYF